jgi:hypothetical protein
MKTRILVTLCLVALITGCSKGDERTFDYDIDLLIGTWRITHLESDARDGTYFSVIDEPYASVFEPTYATFNSNGTYTGKGYFGNGSGTYIAAGKTITTYVGEEEYLKYDVLSLSGTDAELRMYESGGNNSIRIKCQKQ